jgi:hypothetical protein
VSNQRCRRLVDVEVDDQRTLDRALGLERANRDAG